MPDATIIEFPGPRRWYYCGPDLREHLAGTFLHESDALAAILRAHKAYAGLDIRPYTKHGSERGIS